MTTEGIVAWRACQPLQAAKEIEAAVREASQAVDLDQPLHRLSLEQLRLVLRNGLHHVEDLLRGHALGAEQCVSVQATPERMGPVHGTRARQPRSDRSD